MSHRTGDINSLFFRLVIASSSSGEGSLFFDVTSAGGQVKEGESFILGDFGDLTGITGETIDNVACTSVVVGGDNLSLTAVAPADGVRYGEDVAIRVA